ncbi:MAG TPA: four helix bundle protein [Pirellulales bacterium]|nr:four helix bundle protein [Pirellulales bacterium]
MSDFMRVEDLKIYQKLCQLHIDVCKLSDTWPRNERFELTSQVRRSSNSAPANLAEKHSDRHVRNKIEGVNRSRGEALETVHHLYIANLKGYITKSQLDDLRARYWECVRMLNGLERTLEGQLPSEDHRWPVRLES